MLSSAGTIVDVLRWPVIGPILRWRHIRTTLQLVLLMVAAVVVLHGLFGPRFASGNLATVLTWVHYRGLLIVLLLGAGNLLCTACPMVLVRDWGRRMHRPRLHRPAWLRGKWAAAALFALVLFTYELFDLWSLPGVTAWLVLGYFALALVVDLVFTGATFCKHLCPVGQFSFLASTLSPLEVRVRDRNVCSGCKTADCITGRPAQGTAPAIAFSTATPGAAATVPLPVVPAARVQRGCELGLYLPGKVGNLDCTMCLDCVQACPYDNVAIEVRTPGLELADTARRSGIGRLAARPDLAVLAVLFVFGAMINAFAMTPLGGRAEATVAAWAGARSETMTLGVLFVFGLGVLPLALLAAAAALTRATAGDRRPISAIVLRYVHTLVPFGCGVWLAHYGFHLLTGFFVVVPIVQTAALDLVGWPAVGEPLWGWVGMRPGAVFPLQVGAVVLGSLGSAGIVFRAALDDHPERPARAALPWLCLVLALAAGALFTLAQPMEMRGTSGIG